MTTAAPISHAFPDSLLPVYLTRGRIYGGVLLAERASKQRATSGYQLAHVTVQHEDRRQQFTNLSSGNLRAIAQFLLGVAEQLDSISHPIHPRSEP